MTTLIIICMYLIFSITIHYDSLHLFFSGWVKFKMNTLTRPTGCKTNKDKTFVITFVQRRPNVFDVGPTLYKCYTNVLCSLGCVSVAACMFRSMW